MMKLRALACCVGMLWLGIAISAHAAAPRKAQADPKKIAFTAQDTCTETGMAVTYVVKARENWAYVEASVAYGAGATPAKTRYFIMNFESGSLKELYPDRKLYANRLVAGLRATPLFALVRMLPQVADLEKFKKETPIHGTLAPSDKLNTELTAVERSAAFSDSVFAVPEGFKGLDENARQPGSVVSAGPLTILGGP
ncbi:MAG: hypothetical protein M5U26_24850 [Planctomycetota bacterium]|nr:hypothetical protein [Planctomycetota bacterium]